MNNQIFNTCIYEAKQLGDDLFPCKCLEILEKNYKGRINIMNPETIAEKIVSLMETLVDREFIDIDAVYSVVYDWMGGPL